MQLPWFSRLATVGILVVRPVLVVAASPADFDALMNKPVIVTLTDGRTPRGMLSSKSGGDSLVLSTELTGIAIESRFAWRVVHSIEEFPSVDAKPLPWPADPIPDDEAADERAIDNAIPPAPMLPEGQRPQEAAMTSSTELLPLGPQGIARLEVPPDWVTFDPRRAVRSLSIQAETANWDRDAEVDGLLLHVQPLDGFGYVVPVDGNLDVQLATETQLASGGRPISRDDSFLVTERWTAQIHAIDFDATGTIVKVPFRRFHPERHFDIAPDALTFARLRLPSVGAFDASAPFVLLRPASRFRDDLQLNQNRRLLPVEGLPR